MFVASKITEIKDEFVKEDRVKSGTRDKVKSALFLLILSTIRSNDGQSSEGMSNEIDFSGFKRSVFESLGREL